ncbi:MAG: transglutaminaseTgpA domain-containing protein [Microthrixaceae bacterium]
MGNRRDGLAEVAVTATRATAPPPLAGGWYWSAELSCLALGVALALSTTRLFSSTDAVTTLLVVAMAAWALAVGLRRSPLPPLVGDMTHLVVGALLALWVLGPEARFGPLPTLGSLGALAEAVREDFSRFDQDIAPMAARPGHMVVLAGLVWVLALFCSTTAMRLRAPVQASLPHIVAIVGLGFVARDVARVSSTVLLLVAIGLYVAAQGAWRNAAYRWQPAGSNGTARTVLSAGAILVIALGLTALLAPLSPAQSDPVLDLRRGGLGDGGGPRTVVSPFVEVGSNLGPRSDDLLFSASTPSAGYWRLTSLEDYDPDTGVWALANTYERVEGGELGGSAGAPSVESTVAVESKLGIVGLGGIWVPSPADPVFVDSATELNWDPDSGSLVSREGDITAGDAFDFVSSQPEVSPSTLEAAQVATSDAGLIDAAGTPSELSRIAADLTGGLAPYGSALALQDWFRSEFTYDESVDYSASDDPLDAFIEERRGFCQQFSSAFALAARSIGLPARVVVGFTPGASPEPGTYDVYGRNAHAWPEVLFAGIGWVPFEPTPGRGNPTTADITGVPPAQADPPPEGAEAAQPEETTTTAVEGESNQPQVDPSTGSAEVTTSDSDEATASESVRSPLVIPAAIVALGIIAGLFLMWRRRRSATAPDRGHVSGAWSQACSELASKGFVMKATDTPIEFADRVQAATGQSQIRPLAEIETVRRWSPFGTDPHDAAEATALLDSLRAELNDESLQNA